MGDSDNESQLNIYSICPRHSFVLVLDIDLVASIFKSSLFLFSFFSNVFTISLSIKPSSFKVFKLIYNPCPPLFIPSI